MKLWVSAGRGWSGRRASCLFAKMGPLNQSNPHYLKVRVYEPGYGFYNTGFRGIGMESGAEYRFSAYVRSGGPKALRFTITDAKGQELGGGKLEAFDGNWKQYETVIRAKATEQHARLNFFVDEPGTLDLDMVSLFPGGHVEAPAEWIAQGSWCSCSYDMHPGFLRFPGGCIVEGRQLANALSLEDDGGRHGGTANDHQSLER